jgi:hypothetical protein
MVIIINCSSGVIFFCIRFVDGLSEMVVHSYEEMFEFYEQGRRVHEAGGSDLKGSRARFVIYV